MMTQIKPNKNLGHLLFLIVDSSSQEAPLHPDFVIENVLVVHFLAICHYWSNFSSNWCKALTQGLTSPASILAVTNNFGTKKTNLLGSYSSASWLSSEKLSLALRVTKALYVEFDGSEAFDMSLK